MVAPAFGAAGSYLNGASGSSAAVPVPAGVTAGQIVIVHLYRELSAAVTPPAGFTQLTNSPAEVTTGGQEQWLSLWWKRATGNDSGTYSFTWTGSNWRAAVATRYTGCIATGDPIDAPVAASRTTASTTTPAVSTTTTGPDRLLVWTAGAYNNQAFAPPSGFTERADASQYVTAATMEQAAAGGTGSITGTQPNTSGTAFLFGLIPESSPAPPPLPLPQALQRYRHVLLR